jgi:hypothetical protein
MVTRQQTRNERTSIRGTSPAQGEPETNNAVVQSNGGNGHAVAAQEPMPEWMEGYESKGVGLSTKAQDNQIPRLTLLQPLSKQCNSAEVKYVPGAEPGMVHIPSLAERPLIECKSGKIGQKEYNGPGLLVQVCFWTNGVNEWIARDAGGGFVGIHPLIDDNVGKTMEALGAKRQPDAKNPNKMVWMKGNHEFIETRNYAYLLHVEEEDEHGNWRTTGELLPLAVGFKSTEHTFAKEWMGQMNRHRLPNGQPADIWLGLWRVTTRYVSKTQGSWYGWRADWAGWARDAAHVAKGREYNEAFTSGVKEMEAPVDERGDESGYTDNNVM